MQVRVFVLVGSPAVSKRCNLEKNLTWERRYNLEKRPTWENGDDLGVCPYLVTWNFEQPGKNQSNLENQVGLPDLGKRLTWRKLPNLGKKLTWYLHG